MLFGPHGDFFKGESQPSLSIAHLSTKAESHRREQAHHGQVVVVGVHLDAGHVLHFAQAAHLVDENACVSLSLQFGQGCEPVYDVIVAVGELFSF